jgi:hypothetical protein
MNDFIDYNALVLRVAELERLVVELRTPPSQTEQEHRDILADDESNGWIKALAVACAFDKQPMVAEGDNADMLDRVST